MAFQPSNPQILKSDHGHHSADDWALATAHRILPIEGPTETTPATPQYLVGPIKALRERAIEILTLHHASLQKAEEQALATNGDAQLTTSLDADQDANAALNAILTAGQGTALETQLMQPERREAMLEVIHRDFRTNRNDHRHWYATDGADNPDTAKVAADLRAKWGCPPGVSDAAKAWKAAHHRGPGVAGAGDPDAPAAEQGPETDPAA